MRKKRRKLNDNSNKILLIVENSEVIFFNSYFKDFLKSRYNISIKCESSGRGGKCDIANGSKITKRVIEALKNDKFKTVLLMLDLKSKCKNSDRNHTCLKELKKEYLPKYKIPAELKDKFYLFVICNEIESWFLTAFDKKTNNPMQDHKKEIKKLLNLSSEVAIAQKMVNDLKNKKIELNEENNNSLKFFIRKLNLIKSL